MSQSSHIQNIYQQTTTKLHDLKIKRKEIVKGYIAELENKKLADIRKSLGL